MQRIENIGHRAIDIGFWLIGIGVACLFLALLGSKPFAIAGALFIVLGGLSLSLAMFLIWLYVTLQL